MALGVMYDPMNERLVRAANMARLRSYGVKSVEDDPNLSIAEREAASERISKGDQSFWDYAGKVGAGGNAQQIASRMDPHLQALKNAGDMGVARTQGKTQRDVAKIQGDTDIYGYRQGAQTALDTTRMKGDFGMRETDLTTGRNLEGVKLDAASRERMATQDVKSRQDLGAKENAIKLQLGELANAGGTKAEAIRLLSDYFKLDPSAMDSSMLSKFFAAAGLPDWANEGQGSPSAPSSPQGQGSPFGMASQPSSQASAAAGNAPAGSVPKWLEKFPRSASSIEPQRGAPTSLKWLGQALGVTPPDQGPGTNAGSDPNTVSLTQLRAWNPGISDDELIAEAKRDGKRIVR